MVLTEPRISGRVTQYRTQPLRHRARQGTLKPQLKTQRAMVDPRCPQFERSDSGTRNNPRRRRLPREEPQLPEARTRHQHAHFAPIADYTGRAGHQYMKGLSLLSLIQNLHPRRKFQPLPRVDDLAQVSLLELGEEREFPQDAALAGPGARLAMCTLS